MNKSDGATPLLSMQNIGKDFSGVTVLRDVQFDLRAGEVHVLAGENGAGKSTLIRVLGGVYPDFRGSVELDGETVRFHSPRHASARGVSVIHQELSLVPAMSVADNIFLGNEVRRRGAFIDQRLQAARGKAVLRRMGLDLDVSLPAERFPVAVRQMVEIAKALSFEARIIVMDEPTSALSESEAGTLFEVIADLKAQGRGVVFITHRLEEIYRIADRITVLRDGRNAGTGPAAEVDRDTLVRWMAGRDLGRGAPAERVIQYGKDLLVVRNLVLPDPAGGPRNAVDGVSFVARAGEVVGIAGLRGSGASELLNAVFGAYGGGVGGEIFVNGAPVRRPSPGRMIRRGCVLLTNDRKRNGFIPGMNIVQNATLAALRSFSAGPWLRQGKEKEAAERMMRSLNLRAASLDMDTALLSGGNIQKVILGKWLLTEPSVLMLDDPTRGIDMATKEEIYGLVGQYAGSGRAVVLTSSELPELLRLSDRIIVMHRGKVTAEFGRDEATQEKIVNAAMGGGGGYDVAS